MMRTDWDGCDCAKRPKMNLTDALQAATIKDDLDFMKNPGVPDFPNTICGHNNNY